MQVPEKQARRLVKALGFEDADEATPKKLQKRILQQLQSLNGDSIEEMDIPSSSKSLLEEIATAVDDEKDWEIGEEEAEEEEMEEKVAPKKRGPKPKKTTKVKTETKVKTKAGSKKGGKSVKAKAKKSGSLYNPDYQEKRKQEGVRIRKAIESGPNTIEEIAKKAKVTERRVEGHINFNNKGENPRYVIRKNKISMAK